MISKLKFRISNRFSFKNSSQALFIHTYDGSGQAVHPCVIDFKNEYNMDEWGGYRYWMVATPYPNSNDSYENPSIYVSNDGENWVLPNEIANPLDMAAGGLVTGFNNDPDMIYNPDEDKLWIYYRFVNKELIKIKLIKVDKKMICENPISIINKKNSYKENKHRSFCVWRESKERWHMWGGGGSESPPYYIYYFFSQNGLDWSEPAQCLNTLNLDPFQPFGYYNWHFSCKPNFQKHRIEFLCYIIQNTGKVRNLLAYYLRRILRVDINPKNCLMYAECDMNTPTIINVPIRKPILTPSKNNWDNGSLYRATFQVIDDCGKDYYKIWYSAISKKGVWGIGYTNGYITDN